LRRRALLARTPASQQLEQAHHPTVMLAHASHLRRWSGNKRTGNQDSVMKPLVSQSHAPNQREDTPTILPSLRLVEEKIGFQRDKTHDPATPSEAEALVTRATSAFATVNSMPSLTKPDDAGLERILAQMTSAMESSVKRVTESFEKKLDDKVEEMSVDPDQQVADGGFQS
jgi:hypothetical protein